MVETISCETIVYYETVVVEVTGYYAVVVESLSVAVETVAGGSTVTRAGSSYCRIHAIECNDFTR